MTSWSAQQKKVENLDFENSQLECAHDDESTIIYLKMF